ncbi:MAG TPA: isoprenylcysteine carboxylmethyltransferase family protein [Polyangia bacterium]|jgi:protein-S-isoprenylcysteine O-methyltransferase Ste14
MSFEHLNRIALPIAVVLYLGVALVLPTVRLKRMTGVFAIVFQRDAAGPQRLVGVLFGLLTAAILGWALAYAVLGPARLGLWPVPLPLAALGWFAMAAGLVVTLIAQRDMGASWRIGIDARPTALVTGGLFGRVRNPIFSSMLLSAAGTVLLTPCPGTLAAWAAFVVVIAVQVRFEERHLLALHGDAYRAYAARVGRFVPGVGRLRAPGGRA